jgi:hypothetical protein
MQGALSKDPHGGRRLRSAAGLMLAVALIGVGGLWWRSYYVKYMVGQPRDGWLWMVEAPRGYLTVQVSRSDMFTPGEVSVLWDRPYPPLPVEVLTKASVFRLAGVAYGNGEFPTVPGFPGNQVTLVQVHDAWIIAAIAVLLHLVWVRPTLLERRRRMRQLRGQCWACGYELTRSGDPDRCPECGLPNTARACVDREE